MSLGGMLGRGWPTRAFVGFAAGGFAAVVLALTALSSAAALESEGPLVDTGSRIASGAPHGTLGPSGATIRFIEHGRFLVGVLLRNGSAETVTVLDAQTPEPPRSLVRQVSTRLAPYSRCDPRIFCSFLPTGTYAAQLTPVTLAPDAEVGVQLNYQLGSCQDAKRGSFASADVVQITYKNGQDALQQQTLPLGGAKLLLQKPTGVECVPRPYSHIGLVGSFTTEPGHKPVPGSDGDTCATSSSGGLIFRSRLFNDRSQIQWRVKIVFPQFVGRGLYGTPRKQAHVGPADVIVSGGFGDRGQTTFHGHPSTVTVTQAAQPIFGGRFEATLSGKRRFFRAYGAWRCTTKLK